MADENKDLDGQGNSSSGQQSDDNQSGGSENWEARFKGLQRKYNVLVETKGELDNQLADERAKREQIQKQLDTLSNEKESLTAENKKKIDELTASLNEKDQTLSELSYVQKKVKVANELGHPELLQLIETIPNTDDEERIKESMKTILGFTKSQIEAREQQITEGLSPGEAGGSEQPLPSTEEGWMEMIDKLPLGSDKRQEAMDAYFDWTMQG
jgi:chromosome segregation ATPase